MAKELEDLLEPGGEEERESESHRELAGLSLLSLGVVFGDIGTSPLYALRECFHGPFSVEPTGANVLGVLSLILWSLLIVISIKSARRCFPRRACGGRRPRCSISSSTTSCSTSASWC
jgi:hypothetical protein